MILNDDELIAITKVRCRKRIKRYALQREVLCLMGIEHKVRPDGSLCVSRAHVESLLGGRSATKEQKTIEPNWSAMRAQTPQP